MGAKLSDVNSVQQPVEGIDRNSEISTDSDIARVVARVRELLAQPLDQHDVEIVQEQLGRFPRGMVAVGARCVCGNPLAVVTRPLVDGTIPFPTSCYLTAPEATKAVSKLEAAGDMVAYSERVSAGADAEIDVDAQHEQADAADETIAADAADAHTNVGPWHHQYEHAHQCYLAFRHELARLTGDSEEHIEGISAGGMPVRVKCLHALVGQSLVMGEGINPVGDDVLRRVRAEFDPAVCRCAYPYQSATAK